MKRTILLSLAMAATFVSCGASAAFTDLLPSTRGELKAEANTRAAVDENLQGQITQHGYEINTQAKYTTSVNEDLQAAKAAQNGINGAIQGQVNAVQNAAQIANEKADAGAVRADGIEASLAVTDGRSINNAVRLDAAENGIRETNGAVQAVNADLQGAKAEQGAINGQVQGQIKQTNGAVKSVNADLQASKAYQGAVNHVVQGQIKQTNNAVKSVDADLQGAKAYQGNVNHQVQGQITTINDVNAAQQTQINTGAAINTRQDGQIKGLQDYAADMDQRLGGRLDSQQSQIDKNSRDIKQAKNMAAAALAVAAHQFSTDQSAGFQAAISGATIGGAQAIAVGMGGAVSENVFINAAFTKSGSVTGGAVSGTYRFQ